MAQPELLVVGGASLDVIHVAGEKRRSAGGAGLYTALAAHRAGARVTMFAPLPRPMPEQLAPAAARLSWLGPGVAPEALPRFEIVSHGGGRTETVGFFFGAETELVPEQVPPLPLALWAHCVPLSSPERQLPFVRHLRARGHKVACGTYGRLALDQPDQTRRVLAEADAFFCNEAEAATLFGGIDRARVEPGRLLFVTRGPGGARVVQGGHATDLPGVDAAEVDPTGAGDVFCGTVLARLGLGDHPLEAARWGIAHAAEAVGAVGPGALLADGAAPEPAEDARVEVDAERLSRVAALLRGLPEARPFDFTGEVLPPPAHPRALAFFFAATLQQFGFWGFDADRYGAPMLARLGGRLLKGSDYLWAAYRRWIEDEPDGLAAAAQARLQAAEFDFRMRDDEGRNPLPEPGRYLEAARGYGSDLQALGLSPETILSAACADPQPVRALLAQLDHVAGYKEDPLRKKSALLALILRERPERWLSDHGDDVPPVVDYHVQRSCLRLGLLRVADAPLRARLVARQRLEPRDEAAVRRAAFRAVERLRRQSGRSMAACDYFLFQMRHRCPETSEPDCGRCPADPACAHAKELFQPVLRTSFY